MKTKALIWKTIADVPKTYKELCAVHLPRVIHDKVDLENATEIVDFLAGHDLNSEQEDYLDSISTFIIKYEDENDPIDVSHVSGLQILEFLLEQNGLKAADLSRILEADPSLGSKILRGERRLTDDHKIRLGKRFCVSPGLFVG